MATFLLPLTLVPALATAGSKPAGTRIEFSAQAQRMAPNDLGRAAAFVEIAGTDLNEIAQRANTTLNAALAIAKTFPTVATQTGTSRTTPIYGKGKSGVTSIESWRVHSELTLETRDAAVLGELLGQLQTAGIAVSDVNFAPSPEARRKAEDDAAIDAIRVFREKSARYAGALKRPYKIRQLDIRAASSLLPVTRGAAMIADESNTLPVEPGSSNVVMVVKGEIELVE